MALATTARPQMLQASAAGIVTAASRVDHSRGVWLPPDHPYAGDVVRDVKRQTSATGSGVEAQALAEYIACSVPSHCVDGWSYFGRSIQALLRGDTSTSRHLAYYAELRAVFALLARVGIGVLNQQHFIVDDTGSAILLETGRQGTHEFAADAFEWWTSDASSGAFLGDLLRPAGEPLNEWIDQFPTGTSMATVARSRLTEWGFDLKMIADDRRGRNDASYRPRQLRPRRQLHVRRAVRFVESVWEQLSPGTGSLFARFDLLLLRATLEDVYRSGTGVERPTTSRKYRDSIATTVDAVVGPAQLRGQVLTALTAPQERTTFVLAQSRQQASAGTPSYELQVLARAFVLLRLATGAMQHLTGELSLTAEDLEPWWTRWGNDLALWDEVPADVFDPWADLAQALETTSRWRHTNPNNYSEFRDECAAEQVAMSLTELAPVWALA